MNRFTCDFPVLLAALLVSTTSVDGKPIEGFTQPFETVLVAAPEAGIIDTLHVRQGMTLERGARIAVLDNGVLQASLHSARARAESKGPVFAADATHRQRKSRLEHVLQLHEKGHASTEELERAKADEEIARANLFTAREQVLADTLEVKRIEAQIERRTIRSPIRGIVTHVAKRPGEFVSATDATVAKIVQTDSLRVTFHLPTEQIAALRVHGTVKVRFVAENCDATATVDFISPVTDAESNLVRIEVLINNGDGQFRSGVRCLLLESRHNRVRTASRPVD